MKLFLDTNILIDYFGRREPFFDAISTLLIAQGFGGVELWVSAKSFTDAFHILSKRIPGDMVQRFFLASKNFLHVAAINDQDIFKAAQRGWKDFENCLVAVAAENVGADRIITRDAAGFAQSSIPAMSADEYVAWLREHRHIEYAEFKYTLEEIEHARTKLASPSG